MRELDRCRTDSAGAAMDENPLTALKNTHSFDAGGMWGKMDPGAKANSPCFMILDFDGSKYTREYPKKAGTFDCTASNRQSVDFAVSG